jgi:hypothetical protein
MSVIVHEVPKIDDDFFYNDVKRKSLKNKRGNI